MVLLIGLVTKNSILLVEYANQLKAKGLDTIAAVLESGRIRLRPILMTSVSTIMGAIPVMIGVGAGSDRKSTRLNSSHSQISYAVFCLKKKKQQLTRRAILDRALQPAAV